MKPVVMDNSSQIAEAFLLSFCNLVDFPSSGVDCSKQDPQKCVQCKTQGAYFTGESIHDYHSTALRYYYFIWISCVLVSIFGIVSNILIMRVLHRKGTTNRSFDFLLVILAIFDLFSSLMAITASTGYISYFGNWLGRGKESLYWCFISLYTVAFSRAASTYITILITVERFLMVTFPMRAKFWFTPRRTKVAALLTFGTAVLISYPRYTSWTVEKNNWRDIDSLKELEYVLRPTAQGKFWYSTLRGIHNSIDLWLPLPLLLLLNAMSFIKVLQLSKRRKEMNLKEKRDLRAVRMFLPVVVAYFITNIEPMVMLFIIMIHLVAYRELYMLMFFSIAVNSAVNFPIYYYCNLSFRIEARNELVAWLRKIGVKCESKDLWKNDEAEKNEMVSLTGGGITFDSGIDSANVKSSDNTNE